MCLLVQKRVVDPLVLPDVFALLLATEGGTLLLLEEGEKVGQN